MGDKRLVSSNAEMFPWSSSFSGSTVVQIFKKIQGGLLMGSLYQKLAAAFTYVYTGALVISFLMLGFAGLMAFGVIIAGLFGVFN